MRRARSGQNLRVLVLTLALLLTLISDTSAADPETAKTIQLTRTEGTVSVLNASGRSISVREKMRLYSGYALKTETRSYAWFALDDSKLVKLDAESEVEVRRNGKNLELLVNAGRVYFNVTEPLEADESMNICTSSMAAGIRGTIGWVEAGPQRSGLGLLEGRVLCSTAEDSVMVEAGRFTSFPESAEPETVSFEEVETPGFIQVEVVENPALCDKIFNASGLDFRPVTLEQAMEKLADDELEMEQAIEAARQQPEKVFASDGGSDKPAAPVARTFTVEGGTEGTDYAYKNDNSVLTILSGKPLTIRNADGGMTRTRIEISEQAPEVNVTLDGVKIDVSGTAGAAAFLIPDNYHKDVTVVLADGSQNVLRSGAGCAGLQKNIAPSGGILTITGDGELTVEGGAGGAGIGGSGGIASRSGRSVSTNSGIEIDGNFDDWDSIKKTEVTNPNPNRPIAIQSAVIWDGDWVYIYFHVSDGSADAVCTLGTHSNGCFAITTDLGYTRVVRPGVDGGTIRIEGISGAKVAVDSYNWEPENGHSTEIAIPISQLPRYKKSISFGFYGNEPFITDIVNLNRVTEDIKEPSEPSGIRITGGTITASGGNGAAGIGDRNDINATINGSAFVDIKTGTDSGNLYVVNGIAFYNYQNGIPTAVMRNSVILKSDAAIPENAKLTIPDEASLTVSANARLTVGVGAKIRNDGAIQINGIMQLMDGAGMIDRSYGEIQVTGKVIDRDGASINLSLFACDGVFDEWTYYPHTIILYDTAGQTENGTDGYAALHVENGILYSHVLISDHISTRGFLAGIDIAFNGNLSFVPNPKDGNLYPKMLTEDGLTVVYEGTTLQDDITTFLISDTRESTPEPGPFFGTMKISIAEGVNEMEFAIDLEKVAEYTGWDMSNFKTFDVRYSYIGDQWFTADVPFTASLQSVPSEISVLQDLTLEEASGEVELENPEEAETAAEPEETETAAGEEDTPEPEGSPGSSEEEKTEDPEPETSNDALIPPEPEIPAPEVREDEDGNGEDTEA